LKKVGRSAAPRRINKEIIKGDVGTAKGGRRRVQVVRAKKPEVCSPSPLRGIKGRATAWHGKTREETP